MLTGLSLHLTCPSPWLSWNSCVDQAGQKLTEITCLPSVGVQGVHTTRGLLLHFYNDIFVLCMCGLQGTRGEQVPSFRHPAQTGGGQSFTPEPPCRPSLFLLFA